MTLVFTMTSFFMPFQKPINWTSNIFSCLIKAFKRNGDFRIKATELLVPITEIITLTGKKSHILT